MLTSDQQIVLNSGEATRQVIVDQGQIAFQPTQAYMKNDNELVEYQSQQTEIIQATGQQQVFYSTGVAATGDVVVKQQFMPQQRPQQVQLVNHIVHDQRQLVNQQVIGGQRVVTQHVLTDQAGNIMTSVSYILFLLRYFFILR